MDVLNRIFRAGNSLLVLQATTVPEDLRLAVAGPGGVRMMMMLKYFLNNSDVLQVYLCK